MSLNTKIRGAQIDTAYAGDGLGLVSDNLKVNVDGSSIEISTDALQVKALGITNTMLAGSIAYGKLVLTGAILNADLAGSISLNKLVSGLDAQIVVADINGVPTYVDVSGDITITNTGVTAIGALKVTDAMINDDVATGLAGTGLTATAGVLSVDAVVDNIVEADIQVEDESANVDGIVTVFTLTNEPVANSLQVFLNGLLQQQGSGKDYTWSGTSVTFATAPLTGDILLVHYIINN